MINKYRILHDTKYFTSIVLQNCFTLGNCLFWALNLIENADCKNYRYSDYGIEFDARSKFSLPNVCWNKNAIFQGVNNSPFVNTDNRMKDILVLSKRKTQGLDDTTVAAGAEYPTDITQSGKRFVLIKSVL